VIASVVVPTTGDRAELLEHAVRTVLRQTVTDLEVLVIGDGAGDTTRAWAASADPRVRYFDFPKDARRGEVNRHRVITDEARGDLVLYLCDRDLWLPGHVAEMQAVLDGAELGHTLRFVLGEDDRPRVDHTIDLRVPEDRARASYSTNVLPLSMAGHTLAAYRRLPHGWRETPPDVPTDRYMWAQFLEQSDVRVASAAWPTVLSFKRPRTWTVAQRLDVLERWTPRLADPTLPSVLARDLLEEATRGGSDLLRALASAEQSRMGTWARGWMPMGAYRQVRRPARWLRRRLRSR
jgi:glycosyltransferase involved in cell wall biosynthesis